MSPGARLLGPLRKVTLTYDVCPQIKVPAGVIKVVCDPETSRERFLNRQLVTPHIEERFQRRMDEHEDNWRDLTIHYGTLEILVSLATHYFNALYRESLSYSGGTGMLMER